MTLNVVPLPVNNLNNIPEMLRKLADGIEEGEYEADALGSLGLLQLAQQFLGQQIAEGAE
jgi:hypothetical protein